MDGFQLCPVLVARTRQPESETFDSLRVFGIEQRPQGAGGEEFFTTEYTELTEKRREGNVQRSTFNAQRSTFICESGTQERRGGAGGY